jgi:xanthine dehydrogenase YagT iron-sulfur-binding subunit
MAKSRDPETKPQKGLSRRDFLSRGAGVALTTPIVAGVGVAKPQNPAANVKILGPAKVPVVLRINGTQQNVSVEPRVTLLDALRNYLDFTGAKKVCDRATCGACTVIMGGKSVYSCSVLALEAQGKDITTVEGLAPNGKLAAIQAAFVENDAQQCGFCTPGFVVACKAFLDKNPNPTMAQVEKGLGGNLCRCGTYVGVRQAVLAAAKTKGGQRNA